MPEKENALPSASEELEPNSEESAGTEDYSAMTVAELRALAKGKGISGSGTMNKTQLIENLSAN